jgi:hypothetical protein
MGMQIVAHVRVVEATSGRPYFPTIRQICPVVAQTGAPTVSACPTLRLILPDRPPPTRPNKVPSVRGGCTSRGRRVCRQPMVHRWGNRWALCRWGWGGVWRLRCRCCSENRCATIRGTHNLHSADADTCPNETITSTIGRIVTSLQRHFEAHCETRVGAMLHTESITWHHLTLDEVHITPHKRPYRVMHVEEAPCH